MAKTTTCTTQEADSLIPNGPESVPKDRLRMVYGIFYLLGICTLLPWNFFINAQSYFMFKLRNTTLYPEQEGYHYNASTATELQVMFESYLAVAAMLPGVVFMFLNTAATKLISLRVRMISAAVIMILMFGLTIVLARIDTDAWQTDFFALALVTIVIMNAGSAVLQGSIFSLASMFPSHYIQAVMGGMGMGGMLASVTNIAATAFALDKPVDMGFGYFLTANVIIILALGGYLILPLFHFARFHEEKHRRASMSYSRSNSYSQSSINEVSESEGECDASLMGSVKEVNTPMWPVFKHIRMYALCACFTFTITLSVFPAMMANIFSTNHGSGSEWSDKYFTPVTCFLFFNMFDLIGRTLAGVITWPGHNSRWIIVLTVARVVFIPLYWMCNVQPHSDFIPILLNSDIAPMVLTPLMAITNGYIGTLCMMHAPKCVPYEEVALCGAMMSFFLALGLGLGSLISFFTMNFLYN